MQSMSRSSQTANYWDKWDSLWLFLVFKQIPVKLIVAIKCLQSLTCYLALAICYLLSVTCFLKLAIFCTNLFPFARCCTSRNFCLTESCCTKIRARIWQGSIDTIRDSLATWYDIWRPRTRKKI